MANQAQNHKPIAYGFCNQVIKIGDTVSLNGSASRDLDGDISTYQWQIITKPADSKATLSNENTVNPTFKPDVKGTYAVQLEVNNGKQNSDPITLDIHVVDESAIQYVNSSSINPGNGGANNPFKTIQEAINNVTSDSAIIMVAEGQYKENIILPENKNIYLYGGYDNTFTQKDYESHQTIIEASNKDWPVIGFGGYQGNTSNWYSGNSVCAIDGFWITGGRTGIYLNGKGLLFYIRNNRIYHNGILSGAREYNGGGINVDGINVNIQNNKIYENQSGGAGGIAIGEGNSAEAYIPFYIEGNIIEKNSGGADHGGGVGIAARHGVFRNNIVANNSANLKMNYGWGGGIVTCRLYQQYPENVYVEFSFNKYYGNEAKSLGGGVFIDDYSHVKMKNEFIYKNRTTSGKGGAGIYVNAPASKLTFENCTIADNTGPEGSIGNGIYVQGEDQSLVEVVGKNSIIWGNSGSESIHSEGPPGTFSLTISYSNTQDPCPGTANISCDPCFADPENNDYHLKSTMGRWDPNLGRWLQDTHHSPCIDAGDPLSVYANEPMPNGSRINMGAYGNTSEASKSQLNSPTALIEQVSVIPVYQGDGIYISTTGNDERGDGSAANPYRTIQYVLDQVAKEGNTIILRGGVYPESIRIRNPNITIRSKSAEWAVIQSPTDLEKNGSTVSFDVDSDGGKLQRIEVIGGYDYGIFFYTKWEWGKNDRTGACNILIEDCKIHNTGRDCVKINPGCDDIKLRRCEIYASGRRDPSNAEGIDNVNGDRLHVQDCHIHLTATNGIYCKGGATNCVIERTRVENTGGAGILLGFDTSPEWFDLTVNPDYYENIDSIVRNCIVVNTQYTGIGMYAAKNPKVYNNTIVNTAQAGHSPIYFGLTYQDWKLDAKRPATINAIIKNNIIMQASTSTSDFVYIRYSTEDREVLGILSALSGMPVMDHNVYYKEGGGEITFQDCRESSLFHGHLDQWQSHISGETHSIEADPLLDPNYHLSTGSPCIDVGENLSGEVNYDIDRTLRTGAYDIGADET